jgi:PAS domain S-box-containing protein
LINDSSNNLVDARVPDERSRPGASRQGTSDGATVAHAMSTGGRASEGDGLYRLLVESVKDYAIFALDPTGHVLSWNSGAERFKGYAAHEIIGKHFSVFYPEEEIAAGRPDRELAIAEQEGRIEDEGWRLRKDGTPFWANVVITALRDAHGDLVGFAKVTRDLTERRAAELRTADDARRVAVLEEANTAKAAFLAAMSHELRTPLNAIAGYADLLLAGIGGQLTEQQRHYVDRMRGSQQHLLSIINDILNFTRLEAGQLAYDIGPVSLREVMQTVVPMVEPQARTKRLHIELLACPDDVVAADRAKVEQILLNLLSNAVKFTPRDGRLTVRCEPQSRTIALEVCDTGVGISEKDLLAIFHPFVQVGRSLSSAQEGTGLGLAISSDLAQGMGGTLTVRSELGRGSTFTLALPRAE